LQNAESVRDFLVDKLKSAEMAIKASMVEIAALKRQQAADQEVSVAYLCTRTLLSMCLRLIFASHVPTCMYLCVCVCVCVYVCAH
jgi:hypothetical protein